MLFTSRATAGGGLQELDKELCQELNVMDVHKNMFVKGKFCLKYFIDSHTLSSHFEETFTTKWLDKRIVCGIEHKERKIWGVLFHPESHPNTSYVLHDFCKHALS